MATPSSITYATLEIAIGQKKGGRYAVRVRASETIPAAQGTLRLDPEDDPLRALLQQVETGRPGYDALAELGGLLFERLFCGEVAASFHSGWGAARAASRGLRVQLDLEPPELAALPWEYLYDAVADHFFALSTDTPLTRFVSGLRSPLDVLAVTGPLRMLLFAASPQGKDLVPLALDQAIENVEQALDGVAGVDLLPAVRDVTSGAIREALRQHRPHIVHFIGHGSFDEERPTIVLDDGAGRAHYLGAREFARLFRAPPGVDGIRLLMLGACEGAKASSTQPLVGVAHNALRHVPAVVAMQYPVYDDVARRFAREFYRCLAARYPVDAAVSEARSALSIDFGGDRADWGTPVLFLRSADGQLFGGEAEAQPVPTPPKESMPPHGPARSHARQGSQGRAIDTSGGAGDDRGTTSRAADLAQSIRESYQIIRDYERTIQTSDRPEEKLRARREIERQWTLIEGYLREYGPLVNDALPPDIAEMAVRFKRE